MLCVKDLVSWNCWTQNSCIRSWARVSVVKNIDALLCHVDEVYHYHSFYCRLCPGVGRRNPWWNLFHESFWFIMDNEFMLWLCRWSGTILCPHLLRQAESQARCPQIWPPVVMRGCYLGISGETCTRYSFRFILMRFYLLTLQWQYRWVSKIVNDLMFIRASQRQVRGH